MPSAWSTAAATDLRLTDPTEEMARTGKRSLHWNWRIHRNHPDHRVNTLSWFEDNVLTYQSDKPFTPASPREGLQLWVWNTASNTMLRLEVLQGDRVVGRGWYYLARRAWSPVQYPYAMLPEGDRQRITGFRLIAPSDRPPDWPDEGPAALWVDDVDCHANQSTYNGAWIESFEDADVPSAWRADRGSEITRVSARFKSGRHSLRWRWKAETTLSCSAESCLQRIGRGQCLAFWLYNPAWSSQRLRLELLAQGRVIGSCWYYLNYRGWRALAAPYEQIGWQPGQKADGFRLIAPAGAAQGEFHLDFVNFQCPMGGAMNYRPSTPAPDYQQPWIGCPELLAKPEQCLYSDRDISVNRPWLPPLIPVERIPPQERKDLEKLRAAKEPRKWTPRPLAAGVMEALQKDLDRWELRRDKGILTGRAVAGNPGLNNPPDARAFRRDYTDLVNRVIPAYLAVKAHGSAEAAQRMRQPCVDLIEHLVDQGLAEGNNNSFFPFDSSFGIRAEVMFAFSEELAKAGLLADVVRAMNYQAGTDQTFAQEPSGDTDVILGFYDPQYRLLLWIPDPAERLQRLKALVRVLNRICSRLDHQPFGADGTAHHHGMHHWSYASYEIPVLLRFAGNLHDTSFRLQPAVYEILGRFALTMAWSANKYSMPTMLAARPGGSYRVDMSSFAGQLAELGTPDASKRVDPQMASLFLALTDKPDSEQAKKYREMGVKPYDFTGHRALNGAATSLHRRDGWMVSMVGMNKHTGGLEIYGGASNSYSSFARNGSVYVVSAGDPPSCEASGWRFDGWDSRFWSGATTRVVPPQSLWWNLRGIRNASAFAGGTDLDGNGIWGYEHRCLDMQFNKSVFCFGPRITVVTTNIEGKTPDPSQPWVTTLYQNAFLADPAAEPSWIDAAEDRSFPSDRTLSLESPHWLIDNKKTGYYLHPGKGVVKIKRQAQQWFYLWPEYLIDKTKDPMGLADFKGQRFRTLPAARLAEYYKPTQGDFALAYVEHGAKPADAPFAYTLLPCTDALGMKSFARSMAEPGETPYRLVQQDARAHILYDRQTRTTGYALFQAGEAHARGFLSHVNRPCLVMVQQASAGRLRVSVASTDWKDRNPLRLTFRGAWRLEAIDTAQPHRTTREQQTTCLEISYDFPQPTMGYMPIHAELSALP